MTGDGGNEDDEGECFNASPILPIPNSEFRIPNFPSLKIQNSKLPYTPYPTPHTPYPCLDVWRKVEESNPYGSPYPGFQDRLPTIQRHLPKGATDETCSRSVSARRNSLELASQTSASTALASVTLVEARRLELLTFCVQSSCSPIELRPQVDGNCDSRSSPGRI